MSGRSACAALLLALAGPAVAGEPAAGTHTLLVPRPTGRLDFLDPGSGLRLATVALDTAPRRVAVSPDGLYAAVLGCTSSDPARPGAVRVSLVDLQQPRERQRIDLGVRPCPRSLAWPSPERLRVVERLGEPPRVLDLASATFLADPPAPEDVAQAAVAGPALGPLTETIAVQQYLAEGGRIDELALAPTTPRATCHACTAAP